MIRSALFILALSATTAHAAGNAATGASVFQRCAICHSNAKGGPALIGPNLFGIVGRKAGSFPGFFYSPAMKNAGFVWTNAKLDAYLTSPPQIVPGNKMTFGGISNPTQRADLIAYLNTLK